MGQGTVQRNNIKIYQMNIHVYMDKWSEWQW